MYESGEVIHSPRLSCANVHCQAHTTASAIRIPRVELAVQIPSILSQPGDRKQVLPQANSIRRQAQDFESISQFGKRKSRFHAARASYDLTIMYNNFTFESRPAGRRAEASLYDPAPSQSKRFLRFLPAKTTKCQLLNLGRLL
jgi:hypothetical protein